MRCVKRTSLGAELIFFTTEKKLQINQCNTSYQTGKLKAKKQKNERSTHNFSRKCYNEVCFARCKKV